MKRQTESETGQPKRNVQKKEKPKVASKGVAKGKKVPQKKIEKSSDSSVKIKKEEKRGKYEKALTKLEKAKKVQENAKKDPENVKKVQENAQNVQENGSTEKPNWMELKKQRKELKAKRKAKKLTDMYEVSAKAKQVGERLRRSDCTPEERRKLTAEIHGMLKTHYAKVVFLHDMSRIVQWLVRFSNKDIRLAILSELRPCLVNVLQSKYAKNCVRSMLKYGTQDVIGEVISACHGSVVKLLAHTISAPLMEAIYSNWATDDQKVYFKQEFYGDLFKRAKDKSLRMLSDIFKTASEMKPATLSAVKANLLRILNKKLFGSSLVHTVLFEFLRECSPEDRGEMIVMVRDSIVELSRTKFGGKAAVICVWHGTNKDRKIIMKSLKENIKDVCMSEHGHTIMLALFDSIDDTVLLRKIILSEILENLTEIALSDHGKHVISYLVARRSPQYFPPGVVKYLQQGDNNGISKKPAETREKELLEAVRDPFLQSIASEPSLWLSKSSTAMVTLAILKAGQGEALKQAFESVSDFIVDPESKIKEEETEYSVVEHSGLHMVLKKLIQHDKMLHEQGQCTFGEVLVERITESVVKSWVNVNRGCFLIVFLIENEPIPVLERLMELLRPCKTTLGTQSNPGAKILLKKLE